MSKLISIFFCFLPQIQTVGDQTNQAVLAQPTMNLDSQQQSIIQLPSATQDGAPNAFVVTADGTLAPDQQVGEAC